MITISYFNKDFHKPCILLLCKFSISNFCNRKPVSNGKTQNYLRISKQKYLVKTNTLTQGYFNKLSSCNHKKKENYQAFKIIKFKKSTIKNTCSHNCNISLNNLEYKHTL